LTDQDQINEKNCCLVINGGKLTGKALAHAMRAYLAGVPKRMRNPTEKHGKQSVKDLTKSGSKLENIEISTECVKSFERIAAKYAVDYAVMKDVSEDPPKHLVFFKSRDAVNMEAAFREYSAKQLCKSATKPTLKERLAKGKEKSMEHEKNQPQQPKKRTKEATM